MNRSRLLCFALLILLPALGGLCGWLAGPALARANYHVQVAERVWLESRQPQSGTTLQSDAFRAQGEPAEKLYARARAIRARFRTGSLFLGVWCGLVAALRVAAILNQRPRREYEADPADCLACGRCYGACPVELERRKEEAP